MTESSSEHVAAAAPRRGLNRAAQALCDQLILDAEPLRVTVHDDGLQVPTVDCGVRALGSLEAGRRVAEICMAGRAHVQFVPLAERYGSTVGVHVTTDDPVNACLASQYAGWRLATENYFAMGSGPMRAAAAAEDLIRQLGVVETSDMAIGVLEASGFPPAELTKSIARRCDVELRRLTLLVARTSSLVGTIQIVARSVETALHKLHELGFDVWRVVSAAGVAPLPPSGGDDLTALGRTNDAILYGAHVTLWLTGDDASIAAIVERVPSVASPDYGRPFLDLFQSRGGDFYRLDPLLFSPARIVLINLHTGKRWTAGDIQEDLLATSFAR